MSQQPDELEEILGALTGQPKTEEQNAQWVEAKQRLLSWRDRAVREARIDELQKLLNKIRLAGNRGSGLTAYMSIDDEAGESVGEGEHYSRLNRQELSDLLENTISELQDNQPKEDE